MWSSCRTRWKAGRPPAAVALLCAVAAGCKSDLSQQLLERELRYQEDQIYQLQDELQAKCAHLDMLSGENASLRRQLGVAPGDALTRTRSGGSPRPSAPAAVVPPARELPEAIPSPAAPARTPLAPPALDNIPPLPVRPSATSEPPPLALPAPADAAASTAVPAAVPVAYEQPLADGRPVRLVITAGSTSCFDDNGDGLSDGIAVTFEPRDAAEKLVPAPGEVSISVVDVADPTTTLASWSIPAEQAAGHFRPTTRLRGMHFPLRWTGQRPSGDHVRVTVRVTGQIGRAHV